MKKRYRLRVDVAYFLNFSYTDFVHTYNARLCCSIRIYLRTLLLR